MSPVTHVRPEPVEAAPHTYGVQTEQAIEAYREGMMAIEQPEPDRLTDAGRLPGPERDLASEQAQQSAATSDDIDPDMAIGLGEDPGWSHPD